MPFVEQDVSAEQVRTFASFEGDRLLPPDEFKRHLFDLPDSQETVLWGFCAAEGLEFVSAMKPVPPEDSVRVARKEFRCLSVN